MTLVTDNCPIVSLSPATVAATASTTGVPTLLHVCVKKLVQILIKDSYKSGPKKVRFGRLSLLPRRALEALLEILVARNALNDNVLPHALTRQTQKLGLEGASQLRRCVLNTIGRSCPNLRVLDVRGCQQIDNRIVKDVLQHCEHLEALRLDGCQRVSGTAFAPALWKPPLAGLLGLTELSVGKCSQITAEGLMGYVMKGAPYLRTLNLTCCRLAITNEVASELLVSFGLEALNLSSCTQITDEAFQARPASCLLKELSIANTPVTDLAVERLAVGSPALEVFDAGWVMKLTDNAVLALATSCERLKTLCISSTQITDKSFDVIRRCCRRLQFLDASWCLYATASAMAVLAASSEKGKPPIKELVLDNLGGFIFGSQLMQPAPPASPGLPIGVSASPMLKYRSPRMPMRLPPTPPSLALPPPALVVPPAGPTPAKDASPIALPVLWTDAVGCAEAVAREGGTAFDVEATPPFDLGAPAVPLSETELWLENQSTSTVSKKGEVPSPIPPLKLLVAAYGQSLERLLLEGVLHVGGPEALEAIAAACPALQQLALTLPGTETQSSVRSTDTAAASREKDAPIHRNVDDALQAALQQIGSKCSQLWLLRLDSAGRPHQPAVAALAAPHFPSLKSLTLWCYLKDGGLRDEELETILVGRTSLESLSLRNCEGLSDGLFPKWCNRGERSEEVELSVQLDKVLLSSLGLGEPPGAGHAGADRPGLRGTSSASIRRPRRRQHPRCQAAQALRAVNYLSLCNATTLSDRAIDALAELLHDAQVLEIRGSLLLTEEAVRSFRKGCRFLRSVCIVTRDRTLSWTASASGSVKKRHHRKSSLYTSGSSGTESN